MYCKRNIQGFQKNLRKKAVFRIPGLKHSEVPVLKEYRAYFILMYSIYFLGFQLDHPYKQFYFKFSTNAHNKLKNRQIYFYKPHFVIFSY